MGEFTGRGYRPLPATVHIKDSPIDGQGLFAKADIPANTELGETHSFLTQNFDDETRTWERKEWVRTALGAFVNHSNTPNARVDHFRNGVSCFLVIEKDVSAGDEITVKYDEAIFDQLGL
jgi:SET domain-containing protein